MGRDRRVFQRVNTDVPCRLKNLLFGMEMQGQTTNLSLGGAGLTAPEVWPEGSRVRVSLEGLRFKAEAVLVCRIEDREKIDPAQRYGVELERIGFLDLFRLRRILRKRYSGPLAAQ